MADWVTISALASAGGTLVLAGVTVASVRSANRAARVAEQSLLAAQRPLLVPSRVDDPPQRAGFHDDVWLHVEGGGGAALATADGFYLALNVRNIGTGIAVLHGWYFNPRFEGGQRVVTRFGLTPLENGYRAGVGRHWNIDRPQPR